MMKFVTKIVLCVLFLGCSQEPQPLAKYEIHPEHFSTLSASNSEKDMLDVELEVELYLKGTNRRLKFKTKYKVPSIDEMSKTFTDEYRQEYLDRKAYIEKLESSIVKPETESPEYIFKIMESALREAKSEMRYRYRTSIDSYLVQRLREISKNYQKENPHGLVDTGFTRYVQEELLNLKEHKIAVVLLKVSNYTSVR